jgi:hypothetical protein
MKRVLTEAQRKKACERSRIWGKRNLERARENKRRWRKNHLEEERARCRLYYAKHRKERLEYSRRWSKLHSEKVREQSRRWRERHPEQAKEVCKRYYARHRKLCNKRCAEYYEKHKKERNEYSTEYYRKNRIVQRARHRRTNHRVTQEWLDAKLKEQKNRCAICNQPFLKTPHIDHSHRCCPGVRSCDKCRRGLLCADCNLGLGRFKDSIDILKRAVQYLKRVQ